MTESQFILQNQADWKELEIMLTKNRKDADRLNELFVKVSSDLSFARTFYPTRMVRVYLNDLTQRVFESIQRRKSINFKDEIPKFFRITLPSEIRRAKYPFLVSLFIFVVCFIIGAFSLANHPEFANQILGNDYVSMTESNINEGDPMAVYKSEGKMNMFFGITFNNIRVAFLAFVLGIFGSLGTIIILISNGVMVGVFQYYFYTKGLFLTSFLTIWIHGTIEISAIIIAGAAGIVLGNGLLLPKTYKKGTSIRIAAKRSLRILLSTVPLFVIAGALESFVTRLTDMPTILKWAIILVSLSFILFVYVIYPFFIFNPEEDQSDTDTLPLEEERFEEDALETMSFSKVFVRSFSQLRNFASAFLLKFFFQTSIVVSLMLYLFYRYQIASSPADFASDQHVFIWMCQGFTLLGLFTGVAIWLDGKSFNINEALVVLKRFYIPISISVLCIMLLLNLSLTYLLIFMVVVPPQFAFILLSKVLLENQFSSNTLQNAYKQSFENYLSYLGISIIGILLVLGFKGLQFTGIYLFLQDFVHWHNLFDRSILTASFLSNVYLITSSLIVVSVVFFLYRNLYISNLCKITSIDLQKGLNDFLLRNPMRS